MQLLVTFILIFAAMVFIWSFVYLNRSHDQVNQSFLYFLSDVILWMALSVISTLSGGALGLFWKTLYWYSMMNMSLFFLYFVYRLVRRKPDALFFGVVGFNTLTLFARYLFPIDYTDPTFWRLSMPVVAPLMSTALSVPVVVALYLLIRQYNRAKDKRQRTQLRYIYWGIGIACTVSVISEYILPVVFHINTQLYLMFYAILIFVVSTFIAIMKFKLLNMQSDYIFRRLFLNSSDGTVIVNKNARVISVNRTAKEILETETLDSGDRIADFIPEYTFDTDYKQHEITVHIQGREKFLSVTQYPIDTSDVELAKLLTITDITATKLCQIREKDILIQKSAVDQLTGLYNKQYFVDKYYANRRGITGRKLSLMFIDVDNFKTINDTYGHLVGDMVLRALAGNIRATLRNGTDVIRFGGDEFVVILENTRLEDAFVVAERIRKGADHVEVPDMPSDMSVSLSIGLIEGTAPVNDLLMKADMAMYSSKCRGKNTTTVFQETEEPMEASI